MLFDYEESLKRLNRSQSEIDSLRNLLCENDKVPKSITDKLVSNQINVVVFLYKMINKNVYFF